MSATDPIQTAASHAENLLRSAERDVMNARSFDAARHQTTRATAIAALTALEALTADHPSLGEARKRLDELAAKADVIVIDAIKQNVDGLQRAAARELESLASDRERRATTDVRPAAYADKQQEWANKVRAQLDAARPQLTSAAGQAYAAELDTWLATTEGRLPGLRMLGEAFELFHLSVPGNRTASSFVLALDMIEKDFGRDDPERIVLAWDVAKQLIGAFADPRFAEVPEVAKQVARYRALEARIATELRPMLAKKRAQPLIETANHSLDQLKRDTDNLDEARVLKSRAQLRDALAPLTRDWMDDLDTQDFVAKCAKAFARSEADLGDKIVMREIEGVEVFVKPLVECVERGLALTSAARVRDHASRLRARCVMLAPFLKHQRAKLLHDRAEAALARIAPELGAETARMVAEAEVVPRFAIDISAPANVQAMLGEINRHLATYHEAFLKGQELFDEGVDVVNGSSLAGTNMVFSTVEGSAKTMISFARKVEELGESLKKLERAHPVVQAIEDAVPALVTRAQTWKARLGLACDYANAINEARAAYEHAKHSVDGAREGDAQKASYAWPEVIQQMTYVDGGVAKAVALRPDDHDEADAWGAKAAVLRAEAIEKLAAACLGEVTK
ncbi:MAG: hypothetical protein H0T79_19510, partial [Deltaproteobacteria bacterium]|nr:hypothetical protein [Deltaproteobacteria bacterium]